MTTRVETDMSQFEGSLDECECHLFAGGTAPRSLCGRVAREEQPNHGASLGWSQWREMEFCPWCGNRLCATCKMAGP